MIKQEELGITGARGMAALYVFLNHFVAYSGFAPGPITNLIVSGATGVDFFFVLSAYLLSKKMLRGDYKSRVQYYARRIFRIWPTYFVAVTAFALLGLMPFEWLTYVFVVNYFRSTFLAYPIWTLLVEELFYFILPVWLIFFAKGRWKITLPVVFALEVVFQTLTISTVSTTRYFNWSFGSRAFDYAIGTVLGMGISLNRMKIFSSSRVASILMKLGIVLSFLFLGEITGWVDSWFTPIAYSIVYYFILSFFSNSKFFTNKISVFLGRISYSWYLYGWAVTYFLYLHGLLSAYLPYSILLACGVLGISILISYASYRWFERPIIKLGKRLFGGEKGESTPKQVEISVEPR